jgi:hypothetical protein
MGYLSTLGVFDLGAEDAVVPVTMLSEALATAAYSQVGVTLDTSLGGIAFVVSGTSVIGYVGTLTPMAGDGPWYLDGFGLNPNASSTTADGTGSFVNIPPGDYTLTLTGPGTCVPKLSASDAPDTYLAPVRSGFLTAVVTECQ